METFDLYNAAFLKARWLLCSIDKVWNRFKFKFDDSGRVLLDELINNSNDFNVSAIRLTSEIKALKSYISNN